MFNSKLKALSLGMFLAITVGCSEQTAQQVMVQQAVKT